MRDTFNTILVVLSVLAVITVPAVAIPVILILLVAWGFLSDNKDYSDTTSTPPENNTTNKESNNEYTKDALSKINEGIAKSKERRGHQFKSFADSDAFTKSSMQECFQVPEANKPKRPHKKPKKDKTHPVGMFISKEEKQAYLDSKAWQKLRKKVFDRDNYECVYCGNMDSLNCHHITYARLGNEKLSDLTTLCRECHGELHEIEGYSRKGHYPVSILEEYHSSY